MNITIENIQIGANLKTCVISPYNASMPDQAKAMGGRWDTSRKAWVFDARDEQRVRDMVRSIYGTDGSPADTSDLVTVRIELADHQVRSEAYAEFAGIRLAERPGRDTSVRFAANVGLVEGRTEGSAGSMRYPQLGAGTAVVEIRDIPRASLKLEDKKSYTIVDETAPDVDALTAERERLMARIAEIDALLPEPEGVTATTREAAGALGVSVRTVQRWAKSGKVEATKGEDGHWTVTIRIPNP